MPSAINSALSGLNAASKQISDAASKIANQGAVTKPQASQTSDQVSLSSDALKANANNSANSDQASQLTNIDIASYNFKANLKVLQVQQDLDKSLLDIKS